MQENIKEKEIEEKLKLTHEHEIFFERIDAFEKAFKSTVELNKKEHEEIFKRLNEKDIQEAVMRAQLDTVVLTTARIESKIDEQSEIPKMRWEKVVNTIITAVVTAVITALLALIIKK